MKQRTRIERLEARFPRKEDNLVLDLPSDIYDRVDAAKEAGTFPDSLCFDDLLTICHAADKARGYI